MSILTPWNMALIFIMGAEVIHLFQIKFTPDLINLDKKSDDLKNKYKFKDIYPFLLIEIFYLLALFYLLFSPHVLLWFYSVTFLTLGLFKIYIHKKVKNRFLFIKVDSTITILVTLLILFITNARS